MVKVRIFRWWCCVCCIVLLTLCIIILRAHNDHNKIAPSGMIKVFLIELNWWKKMARERGGRGWLRTGTGRFVAQRSAVKILLYVYRSEVQFDRLVFYCCGCKPLEPLYFWISWTLLHMISERVGDKQASSADTTISDKSTLLSPWLVTLPTMINLLSQLFSVVEHCSHSNRN